MRAHERHSGLGPRLVTAAAPMLAVALALTVGAGLIAAIGERPLQIYGLMLRECFGTGYGLGQTMFRATPLVFTGLAVALGFRAGLFNIGVEGQLYLGGFAAGLVGVGFAHLPAVLLLPLTLLAAAAAGGLWGAISGAIAGLGGTNFVLGYKHFFELGFSGGAGFLGIAVALLGRNHPLGVVIAALFFGALSYGGLVINQRVPKELVEMLQGLVILFAISAHQALERAARRMG